MAPATSQYPLKAALTILTILLTPAYLATLLLYYIPKRLRPNPKWSLHTALGNELLRIFYKYATAVRLQPKVYAEAGSLKGRFVLVQPAPSETYSSILEQDQIRPAPVGGIWFPNPPCAGDTNRKVILHFQGGAFVTATDPNITGRFPSEIWAKKMGAITFYAQYRLSRTEDTRFPAALQDLVTFYHFLLDRRIDPCNIIISGDSAGGNLAIALLRYIEVTKVLPTPCAVMAWSPWVDLTDSAIEGYRKCSNISTDFLNVGLLSWGKGAYEPTNRAEAGREVESYISPLGHPFKTGAPLFMHVGTAEVFHEEVCAFAEEMRDVPGNRVVQARTRHAPHDIMLAGNITGFRQEVENVAMQAKEFFKI